jgi:hypothetical protein
VLRVETPALEAHADAERIAHDRPVISVVSERERDAVLAALERGVVDAGRTVAVLRAGLRNAPGFEVKSGTVFTNCASSREAMLAALAALPPHDVLVAEGALAVDLLRARLALAVLPNETALLSARDLRAVRHRIDLFVYDARPALLSTIASAIARGSQPGGSLVASRP